MSKILDLPEEISLLIYKFVFKNVLEEINSIRVYITKEHYCEDCLDKIMLYHLAGGIFFGNINCRKCFFKTHYFVERKFVRCFKTVKKRRCKFKCLTSDLLENYCGLHSNFRYKEKLKELNQI